VQTKLYTITDILGFKPRKSRQTFKCIIDRKEGAHFVGRTEFDSPDVDNEVLIDASKHVKTGEFVMIKILNRI
jgi:ribosomal protein S12 methylthiotransferase